MSKLEKEIAQEVPVQEQSNYKNENQITPNNSNRFEFMDDDEYIVSEEIVNNINLLIPIKQNIRLFSKVFYI